MASTRLPLVRILAAVVAVAGLVTASVLLASSATVDFGGSVYRIDDGTGVAQPESHDVRLVCAANLAGPGEATSSDADDDTYGEDALLDGSRMDDDALPTGFSLLEGELHVEQVAVLATCERVRSQRLSVAGVLVSLAVALSGLLTAYTIGRRRSPV